ncbi:hypothetical protein RHODO2019_18560 (plasmid) [Rhodococcus antarcticus]|uniref:Uncharacterized protein n=1 Tax=Rhodococcus antarcticus TaxID=2987751 RepID=A0ABY6P5Q2_9NOCA|nr:hypothetical protein [Rhodococcus antarcticus]UZJ26995.1 hypothetical protein RHODO2019_18560 [Rhodococcus antarcticus]
MTDQSSVLRGTPAATREVRQAASIQTLLPEPSCAQPSLPAGLSGGATMATAVVDVDVVGVGCAGACAGVGVRAEQPMAATSG